MSKGQRRSNRELKKPKQAKSNHSASVSPTLPPPLAVRDAALAGGRERSGGRNGRK